MIFNMVGGGGGSGATLVVSSPVNVSVTVSKDDKSYTKNSGSLGSTTFKGLATGTWTVTISGNGQTATRTIEITADYAITIAFFSATINITYPANSTCVVADSGGQTVASDTNTGSSAKTWTATVNATGTYTVTATATDGSGKSKSQSVSITADGQSVSVALNYVLYIIKNGVLNSDGFYANASGSTVASENYFKISQSSASLNHSWGYFGPVDLTEYNTLILHVPNNVLNFSYYGSDSSNYGGCGFGVLKNGSTPSQETTTPEQYYVSTTRFSNPYYNKNYSIDVQGLTGSYYVAFDFAPSGNEQYGAISNFYLE